MSVSCSELPPERLQAFVPQTTSREGVLPQPVPRRHLQHGQQLWCCCRRLKQQPQEVRELLPASHQALLFPLIGQIKKQNRRHLQWRSELAGQLIGSQPGRRGSNRRRTEESDLWRLRKPLPPSGQTDRSVTSGQSDDGGRSCCSARTRWRWLQYLMISMPGRRCRLHFGLF